MNETMSSSAADQRNICSTDWSREEVVPDHLGLRTCHRQFGSVPEMPEKSFLRQFVHDIRTALLPDCRLRKFQVLVCVPISACVFTLSMSPELETLDQLL